MYSHCSCVNDFFNSFFHSPLHLNLPLCFLFTTKPQNHPCPSLNHRSLSSSHNKTTKPCLPSLNHQSRCYHPNTKAQKLKLAITNHRIGKNQMKSNQKTNQNTDEFKRGPWQHYIKIEGDGGGSVQLGLAQVFGDGEFGSSLRNLLTKEEERIKRRRKKEKKKKKEQEKFKEKERKSRRQKKKERGEWGLCGLVIFSRRNNTVGPLSLPYEQNQSLKSLIKRDLSVCLFVVQVIL